MLSSLASAQRVLDIAKRLVAEQKAYERIQARYPSGGTPKQKQKSNTDLNWQAHHIVKIEHELHAACVDAGVADLREPEHYKPYSVRLTGFHEYEVVPTAPQAARRFS